MQQQIEVPKTVIGALYLLIRELLPNHPGSVAELLEVLGVGKSQCYEVKERLRQALPGLLCRAGRPPAPLEQSAESAVLRACYDYVTAEPGSVILNRSRRFYSEGFRCFVIELVSPGGLAIGMSVENLARVTGVPLGTLKEWLYSPAVKETKTEEEIAIENPRADGAAGTVLTQEKPPSALETIRDAHMKTIITQWEVWRGPFSGFFQAMKLEFAIPYGSTFIGNILQMTGQRIRKTRGSKEVPGTRKTFCTHFPGAQWLGDGTELPIIWNGQRFVFNVEAILDVATNAVVGIAVTDTESVGALRLAYEASLETTQGVVPYAVTLDNKACNTCDAASAALDGIPILYGFPGRGQSKAALEGAFGLFAQAIPTLDVSGNSDREMARAALQTILTAWYRGRNGRPRQRLNGRTPAQVFFEDGPTQEMIDKIVAWIAQRQRLQDADRRTREARRDPVRVGLLKTGLAELEIADPNDRLAKALACYCRDSIVRGLAIFEKMRDLGTLPQQVRPDRYLRGIIKNQNYLLELEQVEMHLLKQRLRARDLSLEPLTRAADKIRTGISAESMANGQLVKDFLEQALRAPYRIDFLFWTKATTDAFLALPRIKREALYTTLVRRVKTAYKVNPDRRFDLIDRLASCLALPATQAAA
jgi:hypothetical protein